MGLLVAAVGGVAAFWIIGPDNTVRSGEQHVVGKGLAIASTPQLLDRHGPILHVEARSAGGKPVFVGVGRDFDVASYLKGVAHTSLVQLTYPIALTTQEQKGSADPLTVPANLDWWVTKAAGTGSQAIRWPIEDGPYDVVIMSADGKTAPDVQVRVGVEIPNAFLITLGVFVGGLLILALGILLIVIRRRPATPVAAPFAAPPTAQQPTAPAPFGTTYRVLAGTVVLGLVTGCSVVPERDTVTKLTRPAVSTEAGQAVIKRYNEVSTSAGRSRNEVQIGQVEGGDLVKQTRAAYAIGRNLKRPIPKPPTYTKPTFAVPEYSSYPMQFVTTEGSAVGLWQRESAGSPWLRTMAANLEKSAKLPDLTGLRPATKTDGKDLVLPPQTAATALSQYLSAEGKSPQGASFTVLPQFGKRFKDLAGNRALWTKHKLAVRVGRTYSVATPPATFITRGGEAVVLATLRDQYEVVVANNAYFFWDSGDGTAFSRPSTRYTSGLTSTTLHDVVLVVPRKGKGKIRIAAYETQMVDAGGY
ncbi:hypothetical protein ACFCV3_23870 [Kribbella sp. NPDC056345]|uniref:hypothetical protein n=1 Tax=Kribbella sp. NPDC056345 TaxID=3345789 RepID=UPI0035E0388B